MQYTNAGTFEFLMDAKGNFYFMEVNTRIQVEHPVTEWVTGIDIVKEQIRIAAGERLSFKQSEVTFTGHAIECRVNAEDPVTFVPSPGTIHAFSIPGGPGVRVDTAAHAECTIPPNYDSMIAKIIVHGRDRQEAIARMKRTLEMSVVEGIKTSIPLHLKVLNDPDFRGRPAQHALHGAVPAREEAVDPRRDRLGFDLVNLPPLYAVLDADACDRVGREVMDVAEAFLEAGVTCCRCARNTTARAGLLDLVARVVARRRQPRVNHRQRPARVAMLASAAGVHVGQDDMPVAEARALVGKRAIVGVSTHSVEQATAAPGPTRQLHRGGAGVRHQHQGHWLRRGGTGAGTNGVRPGARAQHPGGGDRRHHARHRASVLDAGAASVCVISDLLKGDPLVRARSISRR